MLDNQNIYKQGRTSKGWSSVAWHSTWCLVIGGILIRLAYFLKNESLTMDEAMIALNILERNWLELTQALNYVQAAPLGFLFIEKFLTTIFLGSELVLRLYPLVCSILTLIIFRLITNESLERKTALLSLVFLVLCPALVFYSADAKQYSSDVFFSVLLTYLVIKIKQVPSSKGIYLYAFFSSLALWFSHVAVFLVGTGVVVLFIKIIKIDRKLLSSLLLSHLLIAANFLIVYLASLSRISSDLQLRRFWLGGFLPLFPSSLQDVHRYYRTFLEIFINAFDLSQSLPTATTIIALFLFFLGTYVALVKNRSLAVILIAPILLSFLAAILRIYPFQSRAVLFLVPNTIILVSLGILYFFEFKKWQRLVGYLLAMILVVSVLLKLPALMIQASKGEVRDVLTYVSQNSKPNDLIYVHSRAWHTFLYYAKYCPQVKLDQRIIAPGIYLSEQDQFKIVDNLRQLTSNKQLWFVFSNEWTHTSKQKEIALNYLSSEGKLRDEVIKTDASATLFSFNQ